MDIKRQVQYLQVLARLVRTRKPVNQYLLSPQPTGMGASTLSHLPPAKAGHLSHDLTVYIWNPVTFSLTPFPATHSNPTRTDSRLESPYTSPKLLPTQTHPLLPRIVLPMPAPQPEVLH